MGKMKQKLLNKVASADRIIFKIREKLYMDIITVNGVFIGENKYWVLWVDERWRGKFSTFIKNKSDLVLNGKRFIEELKD